MIDLTAFFKQNFIDDHEADHMNVLIAAALRAEFANTETIAATKELADTDCQFQILTASGAERTVELAPEATDNHVTMIYNSGSTYSLVVKDDSGATTFIRLGPDEYAVFLPVSGETWKLIGTNRSVRANTIIDGLKLIWDSATSVTVGVGSCYAENGDFIDVTSAQVKSGLSLSSSSWYHIYVYLSSGAAAAEVVTTAPIAWKGTAYSKTGDTSRRYVGSIRTDGSGNVYSFIMSGNQINYRENTVASPFRVLSGGTATTETTVSAAAVVPATARIAILRIFDGATTTGTVSTGTSDDNITLSGTVAITITGTGGTTVTFHPLNSSQAFAYMFNTAPSGGSASANIDVYGYILER